MNALIGYGSSDDEENSTAAPVMKSTEQYLDKTESAAQSTSDKVKAADVTQKGLSTILGPAVGPSALTDDKVAYQGYDEMEENEDRPSMSEQDMLRYLTQASHPMSEMPQSPPGSPDADVSMKFKRFLDLKRKGVHFNEDLVGKNIFRNPSLLSGMMTRMGMDGAVQYHSSLPTSVFDPQAFPAWAFKEQLLGSQQTIRTKEKADQQAQSAAGTRTIDFSTATSREGPT